MSGSAGGRLTEAVRRSPRLKAVRLVWQSSRPLTLCLGLDIVFAAVLPILVLVAMGVMVGRIPAATAGGSGSPAGDRLVVSLVLVGVAFLAAMLTAPFHEWLAAAIKIRLTYAMQTRLMEAVSRPIGIAHLEDPAVLDRVALAHGTLMNFFPADAPAVLATVVGQKLALGRGMMRKDPLLLVLDEPTASLDAETEHFLFERYVDAAQRSRDTTGAITVLVSHRFSTVRVADVIVVLDDGRVAEVGSHAELFRLQARAYT